MNKITKVANRLTNVQPVQKNDGITHRSNQSSLHQSSMTDSPRSPERANRLILLGASNLTMSLRLAIEQMQRYFGGPSDVLAAVGHGRSYGQSSRVLLRELPAIIDSGLWAKLAASEIRPTYAVLTDIGNDILYGNSPAQILQWISWCIERLKVHSAKIVLSNLPILAIESLPEWRYHFFRRIFYFSCRLSRAEVVERARAVHQGLIELATSRQCVLCEQELNWMGADGIHYAYHKRSQPYQHFCARLAEMASMASSHEQPACPSSHSHSWIRRPQFARRKMLGQEMVCQQPSGQLSDGTVVSLF